MLRRRIFSGLSLALLAVFATGGCRAQSSNAAGQALSAKTSRDIALTLRRHLQVPPDYVIQIGARKPSSTPGFDSLTVLFELPGHPDHSQKVDFLISKDNKTLERIAHWDISQDPSNIAPAGNRPVRGNPNAKVTLVNFDDLECPFCAKLHAELFPDTLDHYKGLIKIVYRDMPLEQIHPWAMHAAVNANCLAAQSGTAYWNYVDYLHTHGDDITGPDRDIKKSDAMLDKVAMDEGAKAGGAKEKVDATKLNACVTKQDETPVRQEMKLSDSLNVEQTPTLFVNGEEIAGAVPESVLWRAIDSALVAEGETPPPNPYNTPEKAATTREPAAK